MPVGDTTHELPQLSIECGDQPVDQGKHSHKKYSGDSAMKVAKGLLKNQVMLRKLTNFNAEVRNETRWTF